MTDSPRILRERYRLDEALTRNGASSTWLAHDLLWGRPCVVKELSVGAVVREGSTELSYDGNFTKLIDLFEREARVLANLQHSGVPGFIDHFQEDVGGDRRLFTVQEFVAGENLQQLVEGGRHVTEDEAVEICRAVAKILGFLHDRSPPLIHRDVKPSNIILGTDGEVHLVDFGSVRNLLEPHPLDGKTIVGTYGYMPMEQYEGRAVPQSDFYALGMTLLYLLSHKEPTALPRAGLTLDFKGHIRASDRFARLIGWMIEPSVEARPPNAAAILDLLDPRRANLPDLTAGASPSWPKPQRVDRTRSKSGAALVSGIIGLLLFYWGFLGNGLPFSPNLERRNSPSPRIVRGVTESPAEASEPTGGVLSIDLDRDFVYVTSGFPMGRSSRQTSLPPLQRDPPPGVSPIQERDPIYYGQVRLGNGSDPYIDFALIDRGVESLLYVDGNNNEDLLDDGDPYTNDGTGTGGGLAARVSVDVDIRYRDEARVRPYLMWLWFLSSSGRIEARMYAMHHYVGRVKLGDQEYQATVFEQGDHDALYSDAGVCIDLNSDGRCAEDTELFRNGEFVSTPTGRFRLRLEYP